MLVGPERVALIVRERLAAGDRVLDMRRANVYRVQRGEITEVWIFESDQHAVDEFIAGTQTLGFDPGGSPSDAADQAIQTARHASNTAVPAPLSQR